MSSNEQEINNLVSVLIRTKDRPDMLLRAVRSVANQTYSPIQTIIINDGGNPLSKDEISREILSSNKSSTFVIDQFEHNMGRSEAANHAMSMASGAYFLFLDDDDWIAPEHIENLVQHIKKGNNYIAAYSDTACVKSYEEKEKILRIYSEEYSKNALAAMNYLPIHSVLFERVIYDSGCKFDTELSIYEDWHFWIQASTLGDFSRAGGLTAFYSAQISGIGFMNSGYDYIEDNALFFRKAAPYFSPEQIATLQYCYREFQSVAVHNTELEQRISETVEFGKSLSSLGDRITSELERSEQKLSKIESNSLEVQKHYTEINRIYTNLNQQHKDLIKINSELAEKNNELAKKNNDLRLTCENITYQNDEKIQERTKFESEIRNELQQIKNIAWQINYYNESSFHKTSPLVNAKKKIIKLRSKAHTLIRLITKRDFKTIAEKIGYNTQKSINHVQNEHNTSASNHNKIFNIVTPKHTLFVARLIEKHIQSFGLKVGRILDSSETVFDDNVHIVIAPQICKKLPGRYISFQMEQSVSSRWFNSDYFEILENSIAILDYSKTNIKYIQEESNISYKQLFYTPISNIKNYSAIRKDNENQEYDVVFYGDIRNERREKFLEAISGRFKTLVINDLFGDELYAELFKGKVLVNIHYYENALLETTRLYEAISLGIPVISESSSDINEHINLSNLVQMTPVGDIDAMLGAIEHFLESDSFDITEPDDDVENFHFYLGRALLGAGFITEEQAMILPPPIDSNEFNQGLGLSLPESWERNSGFKNDLPEKCCFPGLRHKESWKGCAMSYKYLAHHALDKGLKHLEVMEDDVLLTEDAKLRWEKAKNLFLDIEHTERHCDLLSGLLADVSSETKVLEVFELDGYEYAIIDRMISAVCNYYGEYPLNLISRWNPHNSDINNNTMDRYLESYRLRVLVPMPFIAGHKPENTSTLWSFSNEQYDDLIERSEKKLSKKIGTYKSNTMD